MLQNYVTPLSLTLVVTVHIVCLVTLVAVLRTATRQLTGWRMVLPSGMHWIAFLGNWALTILISWIWLFVGSARRDAEEQMWYAYLSILVFGSGAALCGIYVAQLRRMALRWQGTTIRWCERGEEITQDMAQFDAYRRAYDRAFQLHFRDGTKLRLDPYARNAKDLRPRYPST